jgi:hypothetical protein
MRRMNINQRLRGRKLVWKYIAAYRAMTQNGTKGGIDAIRYRREVLIPKLIPFALEYKKTRPDTIVQEDNASSHTSKFQNIVYSLYDVICLLWLGNSLDLNVIEPC